MTCRNHRDLLSPYLDGELDPRRRAGVAAHLSACPACAAELEALRRLDDDLRAFPLPQPGPEFGAAVMARLGEPDRRRWHPLPAMAYAMLFLIVFAAGFFLSNRESTPVSSLGTRVEVEIGATLAENRDLGLLAIHDRTISTIEEMDRAQP